MSDNAKPATATTSTEPPRLQILRRQIQIDRLELEIEELISTSLADGHITPREYDRINRETLESVSRQLELLERLRGMVVDRPEVVGLTALKPAGGRRA